MYRESLLEPSTRTLQITPWDRRVLQLLATGRTRDDLAASLGISTPEMDTRLRELFAAIGAATEADAIAAAHRRGLVG